MKKLSVILFLCISVCNYVFASPAHPGPYLRIQPNGDSIYVYWRADEYGGYYTDLKKNVVAKNEEEYWVYVMAENNKIVLTNQIVTSTSVPININRKSVFNLISQKRMESRQKRLGYNSRSGQTQSIKLPSTGNPRILTVLVQFPDVEFQSSSSIVEHVKNMMKIDSATTNINSCVQGYYLDASYEKLRIDPYVIGPFTAKNNRSHYGVDKDENDKDTLVGELVNEIIDQIIYKINIGLFDNDRDSLIECLHIVYAGEGQDLDSTSTNLIWPHKGELINGKSYGGFKIRNYMVTPELFNGSYRGIGTICHELGHILGAPDFYDTNTKDNDSLPGTGYWDLMNNGDKNNNINNPAMPNPYLKTEIFKWATAKELMGNDSLYTLRPSELDSNSIYKLSTSTPNEYYLLENRQDVNLPGTGLVVYHVNAGIENHIDSNDINVTHRQNMYVVDANNHIVKPTGSVTSYGNINSPNATFRSTNSKNMYFTSTSLPSNCDWNKDTTYNKNVCFISEEMIDGEKCILFVLNPEIEGDDILCDSSIYLLKHVPSEATIEWTYIRPSGLLATTVPLIIGSGQGTKAVCFKRGYKLVNEDAGGGVVTPEYPFVPAPTSARGYVQKPYSGFVEIQAKVTLNGETKTWRKTIYMPEKVEMNTLSNNWFAGAAKTITLKTPTDARVVNDITWNIELPGEFPYSVAGSSSITVTPRNGGTARFTATYMKGCNDEYMSHTKTYTVIKFPNLTYTNPASGSLEISVVNGDAQDESGMRTMSINNQPTPYMGAYRVELWHDVYGKVKEMDVPENTPTITMNLEGLNSGVYVLRLIIDNQIVETSQLIVK